MDSNLQVAIRQASKTDIPRGNSSFNFTLNKLYVLLITYLIARGIIKRAFKQKTKTETTTKISKNLKSSLKKNKYITNDIDLSTLDTIAKGLVVIITPVIIYNVLGYMYNRLDVIGSLPVDSLSEKRYNKFVGLSLLYTGDLIEYINSKNTAAITKLIHTEDSFLINLILQRLELIKCCNDEYIMSEYKDVDKKLFNEIYQKHSEECRLNAGCKTLPLQYHTDKHMKFLEKNPIYSSILAEKTRSALLLDKIMRAVYR
jgi:hypothetical protein